MKHKYRKTRKNVKKRRSRYQKKSRKGGHYLAMHHLNV